MRPSPTCSEVRSVATVYSIVPACAVLVPLAAAVLILLSRGHEKIREGWTILAAAANFLIVLSLLPQVLAGDRVACTLIELLPGLDMAFRVDAFGMLFALVASGLWIVTSIYSIGYMRALREHALTRYFFSFAVAIAAALGIAFSANLVTMFIFYEILTISTYPLVAHTETEEARKAGRKYLAYLITAGVFFLFSVILTYFLTGTTDFQPGGILAGTGPVILQQILFVTFLIGFAKAAWMPLHGWLPSAMVAPAPVSALLHAVAVVKAGVFGIVRVVCYVYGIELTAEIGMGTLLAVIAGATIITGSLLALQQDNLKQRLAYSTVSQLSYILLGVALLTPMGITGAMLHIPFHAFMKITLFFCAGALIVAAGVEYVSDMKGIGRRMPVTMLMFSIGAIGICSLPPVCGIISKWYLVLGAMQVHNLAAFLVLITSSVLNILYFFPIIHTAFFEEPESGREGVREAPLSMLVPLAITAVGSVLLFLAPDVAFLRLVEVAIGELTGVLP